MIPAASRHIRSTRRGSAAVEFAVVLPLLVTFLLAVWDFGRLIGANQILTNAAREAGRQAASGRKSVSDVAQVAFNNLNRAGISSSGATLTITNVTNSARSEPTGANQLDRYELTMTMPSNNARFIILNSLLGTSTLRTKVTWLSMADIPLTVPSNIPVN